MSDVTTLETTLKELQQRLQRELKIRQAADQMLSTAKEKEIRVRIKGELDKSNKRITVYSNDLERLKHSLSTLGDSFGIAVSMKHYAPHEVLRRIVKLQEKIDGEIKIHEAAEKLYSMYDSKRLNEDKKVKSSAQNSLKESWEKIRLLKSALSKYQSLDRGYLKQQAEPDLWTERKLSIKKTAVTGKLIGTIGELLIELHDIDISKTELSMVVQIDHKDLFRTKWKRNILKSPWNEKFEISLVKATEIEFLLYAGDHLCAMLFFPLQEVVGQSLLEQWYDMEPNGQLRLRLNFKRFSREEKVAVTKKRVERARRVERRKIVEFFGHRLAFKRFYQILKCAVCMDIIVGRSCLRCEACMYTCHIRCKERSFAKCISTSTAEAEKEGLLVSYRIPHRFNDSMIGIPTFCCHCGHILPTGRRSKKCSECQRCYHDQCTLFVSPQCGLTGDMAEKIQAAHKKSPTSVKKLHGSTLDLLESKLREVSFASKKSSPEKQHPFIEPTILRPILDNYKLITVIGKGNFGKVFLAEDRVSGRLVAVKVLKKEFVIENDELESVIAEKRVFLIVGNHPFLVNMESCFQSQSHLYFVMEYVAGGDLMFHIQRESFDEKRSKFYSAEVLLALEYLHSHNVIYRDLKLDNILLGLDGHIKLADYGLCKEGMNRDAITNTFCGTPEFMAPEVILEEEYGLAVDWWAYGVLIYELLSGQSPFSGDGEEEIFDAILENELTIPKTLSPLAEDLIRRLLVKDPTKRLGTREGATEIKKHPFFQGIDWQALFHKRVLPPFIPIIRNSTDVSNFDREFTSESANLSPTSSVIRDMDQEEFRGFSFIRTTKVL